MKPKFVVCVGASTSGKSTYTQEWLQNHALGSAVELNRDNVRFDMFCNGKRDYYNYHFCNKNEKKVSTRIGEQLDAALELRQHIICSDTNLNIKYRERWKQIAKDNGYEYSEVPFPVEWEELKKRNNQREGGISQDILRSQYYKMQEYLGDYKYVPDDSLTPCVLVDIDGTVALKGDRGYFDWDKVEVDKPRRFVIAMLQGLIDEGYEPIFLSGRDGSCQEETYSWIYEHIMETAYFPERCHGFRLFMREAGDIRKDYIVKKELFFKYINGKFDVQGVLDDRPSVLQNCWLDLGLPNVIATADQTVGF